MARPVKGTTLADRFWARVVKGEGCWGWTGKPNAFGYGTIRRPSGGDEKAHRVSWELHSGPIPSGLVVRHKCDNTGCVRPDHLELGTQKDNVRDALERGRWNPPVGERNAKVKLTAAQVADIQSRHKPRVVTYQMLADEYGVSYGHVQDICRRIGRFA